MAFRSTSRIHIAWKLLAGIVVLVAARGCSSGAETETGGPVVWTVSADPTLQIGEQDGPAEYLFDQVNGVRLTPDGGVVVADEGSGTVRVYDAGGALSASMGRRGEGPGEFSWLSHVEILAPDTILAYDGRMFRVTRFLLDGTHIDERSILSDVGSPELYLGTYADGGAAIASLRPSPRGGTEILPDQMVVARYGPDGERVAELGVLDGIRRAGGVAVVPFSPFLHAFVLGDSVFYTDGMEPALHVLGAAGTPARSFTVPIASSDLDASWSVLRRELEARDELSWIEDLSPEVEALPVPAVGEVMLDAHGRFWLKHYDPATDASHVRGWTVGGGRWTVVDPDGREVASVDLPAGFAPMDASGMQVAGVQRDDLGVERVVVLELEERA